MVICAKKEAWLLMLINGHIGIGDDSNYNEPGREKTCVKKG